MISKEKLLIAKEVLFGGQKQSSDINDSVASICAERISEYQDFSDHVSFRNSVVSYLSAVVNGEINTSGEEIYIMLLTGLKSYEMLKSGEIVRVSCVPASNDNDSLKINFRIKPFFDVENEDNAISQQVSTGAEELVLEDIDRDDFSPKDIVQAIVRRVVPIVPTAVKEELDNDELKIALYGYEDYMKYNSGVQR